MACKSCGKSRTSVSKPRTATPIQQRQMTKHAVRISTPRKK